MGYSGKDVREGHLGLELECLPVSNANQYMISQDYFPPNAF